LARWVRHLRRFAWSVFLVALVVIVVLRCLDIRWSETPGALALIVAWAGVAWMCAFLLKPRPAEAMALWDERTGRRELFLSAYCFESLPDPSRGERLHLARAESGLASAVAALRDDFPLRFAHRCWILPILLLSFATSGVLKAPIPAEDVPLDESARKRAQEIAQQLAEKAKKLSLNEGLSPKERKRIEELKGSMKDTAGKMRKLTKETPRDVLEELERKAREAEKLARELEGDAGKSLSSKMIAELERHADTAELAAGLRADDYDKISKEADELAGKLRADDLSLETSGRIEHALDKALKVASAADKRSVTGEHLDRAHQDLEHKAPKQAADEFSRLGKHFKRSAQRKRARRQLEQLAKNLRKSGRQILGQRTAGMRQLAQAQSLQPRQQLRPLAPLMPGQLRNMGRRRAGGRARMASSGNPGANRMGTSGSNAAPVPGAGTGLRPTAGTGQAPVPGTGQPSGSGMNPGGGGAPVPGTGSRPGAGAPGSGNAPVPGMGGGGVGGLRAGTGSAAYTPTKTVPLKATSTKVVKTGIGKDGETLVRHLDPRAHTEESALSTRELSIQFIKAEEEALNSEPLPLTRREQVLRYFTELRRQLEHQP